MHFSRHRGVIRADIDDVEISVLTQLTDELLGLIEEPAVSDDPLAAMVGMPPGDVDRPDSAVLERLLPDAYKDDPEAAGEFRRFTDADLRTAKRAHAATVRACLPAQAGRMTLDREQADSWLLCLNDLRLALGTALDVTEETDPDDYEDPEDPAYQALGIYSWLGWLQESLLSCLEPRLPS